MHFDHLETISFSFFYVAMKFIALIFSKDTLPDLGLAHTCTHTLTQTHAHAHKDLKQYRFWYLHLVKMSNISTLTDKEMVPGILNDQQ